MQVRFIWLEHNMIRKKVTKSNLPRVNQSSNEPAGIAVSTGGAVLSFFFCNVIIRSKLTASHRLKLYLSLPIEAVRF